MSYGSLTHLNEPILPILHMSQATYSPPMPHTSYAFHLYLIRCAPTFHLASFSYPLLGSKLPPKHTSLRQSHTFLSSTVSVRQEFGNSWLGGSGSGCPHDTESECQLGPQSSKSLARLEGPLPDALDMAGAQVWVVAGALGFSPHEL